MEVNFAAKAPSLVTALPVEVAASVTSEAPSAPPAPAAPALTTENAAIVHRQQQSGGLGVGDKLPEFKDIILPRLNIVQNIGELVKAFPRGAIVFNQRTVLFTAPILPVIDQATGNATVAGTPASPPINIVCLGFRPTRYAEKVPGGGRGIIVNTEAEVRANGGTLDYTEHKLKAKDGMKRFEYLAEAMLAIERPDSIADDGTVFVFPVDGKKYALALWAMKGTAYTAAAKRVFFTERQVGCLQKGYPSRSFSMTTRLENYPGGNSAWIPVLIPGKESSPEFLRWVDKVLNPVTAAADATGAE